MGYDRDMWNRIHVFQRRIHSKEILCDVMDAIQIKVASGTMATGCVVGLDAVEKFPPVRQAIIVGVHVVIHSHFDKLTIAQRQGAALMFGSDRMDEVRHPVVEIGKGELHRMLGRIHIANQCISRSRLEHRTIRLAAHRTADEDRELVQELLIRHAQGDQFLFEIDLRHVVFVHCFTR